MESNSLKLLTSTSHSTFYEFQNKIIKVLTSGKKVNYNPVLERLLIKTLFGDNPLFVEGDTYRQAESKGLDEDKQTLLDVIMTRKEMDLEVYLSKRDEGDGQPIDLDQVNKFLINILLGLEYLHSRGIIHKDVKPSNLLLHKQSQTHIQLTRSRHSETSASVQSVQSVTGKVKGTEKCLSNSSAGLESGYKDCHLMFCDFAACSCGLGNSGLKTLSSFTSARFTAPELAISADDAGTSTTTTGPAGMKSHHQRKGHREYNEKIDIWAFGCIAFELVYGDSCFGDSVKDEADGGCRATLDCLASVGGGDVEELDLVVFSPERDKEILTRILSSYPLKKVDKVPGYKSLTKTLNGFSSGSFEPRVIRERTCLSSAPPPTEPPNKSQPDLLQKPLTQEGFNKLILEALILDHKKRASATKLIDSNPVLFEGFRKAIETYRKAYTLKRLPSKYYVITSPRDRAKFYKKNVIVNCHATSSKDDHREGRVKGRRAKRDDRGEEDTVCTDDIDDPYDDEEESRLKMLFHSIMVMDYYVDKTVKAWVRNDLDEIFDSIKSVVSDLLELTTISLPPSKSRVRPRSSQIDRQSNDVQHNIHKPKSKTWTFYRMPDDVMDIVKDVILNDCPYDESIRNGISLEAYMTYDVAGTYTYLPG